MKTERRVLTWTRRNNTKLDIFVKLTNRLCLACFSLQIFIDPACWGDVDARAPPKLEENLAIQERKLSNLAQAGRQLEKRVEDLNAQVRYTKFLKLR
jgi:hypothetical protein